MRSRTLLRGCSLGGVFIGCLLTMTLALAGAAGDQDLVRKLGDANARVRDQATKELLARGRAATEALKAGAQDADLEVRRRSEKLLQLALRSDLDLQLDAFLKGKDDGKQAWPGWETMKKIMGDDETNRYLYTVLFRTDKGLLETLDKNPKSLASQFNVRFNRVQQQIFAFGGIMRQPQQKDQEVSPLEDMTALLLIANLGELDSNHLSNLMYLMNQPRVQAMCSGGGMLKLSTEFKDKRLIPAVNAQVQAVLDNPKDLNKFYQALNLVRQTRMTDLIDTKLKPAARKALADCVVEPVDLNRVTQAASMAQNIGGMQDEMKTLLGPIATKLASNVKIADNNFYQLISLLQISQRQDLIEDKLKPAMRTAMKEVAAQKLTQPNDLNNITQLSFKARNLGMVDDVDKLLKPAALTALNALVDQGIEANRLQQAMNLAQSMQLQNELRPTALRVVDQVVSKPNDLHLVSIANQFARVANLPDLADIVEKKLKPAARKALEEAKDQPILPQKIGLMLNVMQELQMKEGADLALRAAGQKDLAPYLRSQAFQWVARNGNAEQYPALEAMIGDTTKFNNGQNFQMGDVALACLVHMSNQKLSDYGFTFFRANPNMNFIQAYNNCNFDNDKDRQAAHKKWRDWREEQAKEVKK
jgi:hypothetical protein